MSRKSKHSSCLISTMLSTTALISGCSENQRIRDKSNQVLYTPIVEPNVTTTLEEIPIYLRGSQTTQINSTHFTAYPLKKREVSEIYPLMRDLFPELNFAEDRKTNQLLYKIDGANSEKLSTEVSEAVQLLDISPAQYIIKTIVVKGSATEIRNFRTRLDILVSTGDVNFALRSSLSDSSERTVAHSLSAILNERLPNIALDAFIEGLNSNRYVMEAVRTYIVAENSTTARISAGTKVEIPRIISSTPVQVAIDLTDVNRSLEVTPHGFSANEISLKIKAQEGEVINQGTSNLPRINTREVDQTIRVKLGQAIMISSTLDMRSQGSSNNYPLFGDLVSGRDTEKSRTEVVYILIPERVLDWPTDKKDNLTIPY